MNKRRKQIIESYEVSKLVTYNLGGYEQKVLIEGKSRKAPVMISLHGGPGSPIPFSEGCRGMFPEITDSVIMVYWDQLGCGINNYVIDNSFCIDDFVAMTVDLIREIKKEFSDNKIILFGMSWGSILAAKTAMEVPELIDHAVTYGQVLHDMTFNEETYGILAKAGLSDKEMIKLSEIKNKSRHSIKEVMCIMKWIQKYTEGYQCKAGKKTPLFPVVMGILSSPDYRFRDFLAIIVNGYRKNTSLIEELMAIDLRETFRRMTVPYLILQGSTDIVTSTKAIQEFLAQNGLGNTKNENVTMKLIQNSGHMPGDDAMADIFEEIQKLL